jgi:hypothetical protein
MSVRRTVAWSFAIALSIFSIWFVLLPIARITHELGNPSWRDGTLPESVVTWHQSLSDRFAPWAEDRVTSLRAKQLAKSDVSGTEWPLFSSVMYLWATESIQEQWQRQPWDEPAPAIRNRAAIEAAARLVSDPGHAEWVRQHWGDGYLREKNLFYRMLLIAGLDSYERLSEDRRYHALLREQSETMARELDASPHGILDDYPNAAYSVDVLLAYAVIARTQRRLGTADAAWVARARRAFSGDLVDAARGLPAYGVDSESGIALGDARGVGLSMMLIWAHELWPDVATQWYDRYIEHYWQERWGLAGFREFPRETTAMDWTAEVDAGPIIAGFGTAANGFGLGTTRIRGDMRRGHALTAQALVAAWPLPNGTLLGPRLVSNLVDAPYTGEAALLFAWSRMPASQITSAAGGAPAGVWLALVLLAIIGIAGPLWCIRRLFRVPRPAAHDSVSNQSAVTVTAPARHE